MKHITEATEFTPTTDEVRRQIQDGARSSGAIDGDMFDRWLATVAAPQPEVCPHEDQWEDGIYKFCSSCGAQLAEWDDDEGWVITADPQPVQAIAHIECDCIPELGPSHCHKCGDEVGHPVAWADSFHGEKPQPVGDVAELIAELDKHGIDWAESKNLGYYRTEVTCDCGEVLWFGSHEGDPKWAEVWTAHRLAALVSLSSVPPTAPSDEELLDAYRAGMEADMQQQYEYRGYGSSAERRTMVAGLRAVAALTSTEEKTND